MKSDRYKYSCLVCGGAATKEPCRAKGEDGKANYSGLGGWRCDECGPGIKVKREIK